MDTFDLRGALAAVTPLIIPYSLEIDRPTNENTLNRLEMLMYEATNGLEANRFSELVSFLYGLLADAPAWTAAALDQQRQGALTTCDRQSILRGADIGVYAATAPDRFLHESYWPEVKRQERSFVSATLYAMYLVAINSSESPWGDQSCTPLKSRRLALSVGAACQQEIVSRLAQHPSSRDVYEFVSTEKAAVLQRLLGRIRVSTRDLPRDVMDSPPSALWMAIDAHLRKAVVPVSLVGKTADFSDPSTRAHVLLYLAMGGELDYIPVEVRRRWIDELRRQSTQQRGGDGEHRPTFQALTTIPSNKGLDSYQYLAPAKGTIEREMEKDREQPREMRTKGLNRRDPSWYWRTTTYEGPPFEGSENCFQEFHAGLRKRRFRRRTLRLVPRTRGRCAGLREKGYCRGDRQNSQDSV
jgi:hypothetical protein